MLVLLIAAIFAVNRAFCLETVVVAGNRHNTAADVTELIVKQPTFGNTLLAYLFNRSREISGYGFIDSVDSEILDRNTLRVTVTERRFIGRVLMDGVWWYLDTSGTVMASSKDPDTEDGIPAVEGLNIQKKPELGQVLPIANTRVFSMLSMLLNRIEGNADLVPDKAVIGSGTTLTLVYGEVRVQLGNGEKLELRLKELAGILKELDTETGGTLHLENYDGSQRGIIFDPD